MKPVCGCKPNGIEASVREGHMTEKEENLSRLRKGQEIEAGIVREVAGVPVKGRT